MKKYVISAAYGDDEIYYTEPLIVVDAFKKAKEESEKLNKFFKTLVTIKKKFDKIYNYTSYNVINKITIENRLVHEKQYKKYIKDNFKLFVEKEQNKYSIDYIMMYFDAIAKATDFGRNVCKIDKVNYI